MFWDLLLLLLLSAGHAEMLVTIVNRTHGLPIPQRVLKQIRHAHDVLIPLFPLALIWWIGLNGPRVLLGGDWRETPPLVAAYLGGCSVGVLGLMLSIVRWGLRSPPAALTSSESHVVDMTERLGGKPLGNGPFRMLARLPGNEIFRVEFSEKEFHLPGLPPEWEGLSIVQLSDFHFLGTMDRRFFEEATDLAGEMQPDLFVFTGDLVDSMELLSWLPSTLGKLHAPLGCYYILGNHDWDLDPPAVRAALQQFPQWIDVAGRAVPVPCLEKTLLIAGSEWPWMENAPDLANPPADFRLLLSHTPDNILWARNQRVDLMLSGHNHGGQVVLPLVGPVYSPSRFGVKYSSGAYWEEPTLLYVSRGLSARHPLRLGALPEVTKIILRPARTERTRSQTSAIAASAALSERP